MQYGQGYHGHKILHYGELSMTTGRAFENLLRGEPTPLRLLGETFTFDEYGNVHTKFKSLRLDLVTSIELHKASQGYRDFGSQIGLSVFIEGRQEANYIYLGEPDFDIKLRKEVDYEIDQKWKLGYEKFLVEQYRPFAIQFMKQVAKARSTSSPQRMASHAF